MSKKRARMWTGLLHPGIHAADAKPQLRTTCATSQAEPDRSACKNDARQGRDWRPRLYW